MENIDRAAGVSSQGKRGLGREEVLAGLEGPTEVGSSGQQWVLGPEIGVLWSWGDRIPQCVTSLRGSSGWGGDAGPGARYFGVVLCMDKSWTQ